MSVVNILKESREVTKLRAMIAVSVTHPQSFILISPIVAVMVTSWTIS